ncbi:MAG: hypothetical protein HY880_01410 [Deltaproteobacteria bacterium]|nr:hypothetical protein [Deltaproteobacteria bacterium]
MIKRYTLVLDFSDTSIRAGMFTKGGVLVCEFEAAIEDGDTKTAIGSILEGLAAKGYAGFSRVAVGLPQSLVSIRIMETPFPEIKKIEEVASFEIGEGLLKEPEDYLFKVVAVSEGKALVAAVEREGLKRLFDEFRKLGIDPEFVSSPLFFKYRLFECCSGAEGTVALIDETSISIIKAGALFLLKSVHSHADIELVWAALSSEGIEINKFYCTKGGSRFIKEENNEIIEQFEDNLIGLHAIFNGFRKTNGALNFRTGEFANKREALSRKRALMLGASLAASLCMAWGLHTYLNLKNLDIEMKKISAGFTSGYNVIFGTEVVASGDPLYELEAKYKGLGAEKGFVGAGQSALGLMKKLSEASVKMEKGKEVRLKNIEFFKKRLTLGAETVNLESANRFRDILAATSGFKDIALSDVMTIEGSRVSFTLTAAVNRVQG